MDINKLPRELIYKVLDEMSIKDITTLMTVNHDYKHIVENYFEYSDIPYDNYKTNYKLQLRLFKDLTYKDFKILMEFMDENGSFIREHGRWAYNYTGRQMTLHSKMINGKLVVRAFDSLDNNGNNVFFDGDIKGWDWIGLSNGSYPFDINDDENETYNMRFMGKLIVEFLKQNRPVEPIETLMQLSDESWR